MWCPDFHAPTVLPLWERKLRASRGTSPRKVSPRPGSGPWHRLLKFNLSRQLGTYSICTLRKNVLHLGVTCVMTINVTAIHVNAIHMAWLGLHWTEGYQPPGADISHTGAGVRSRRRPVHSLTSSADLHKEILFIYGTPAVPSLFLGAETSSTYYRPRGSGWGQKMRDRGCWVGWAGAVQCRGLGGEEAVHPAQLCRSF